MAIGRPGQSHSDRAGPVEWYGRAAQRLGGVLTPLALAVVATSGTLVGLRVGTAGGTLRRLIAIASADPATLPPVAAVCHYGLFGVAVGTWFLGLGFILTGVFE